MKSHHTTPSSAVSTTPVANAADFRLKTSFVAIAACFMPWVYANPVGPVVVHGTATMATQGSTLSVTNTPGTVLNWQQFNIGQGQTTQFIQPSAQSAVLNRVIGTDASQIMGTLRSNGQVFLINPNGILFGAGAVIDVNRLIASTLNITDANFLANNLKFGGSNGTSVVNQGRITTPLGGSVYLIGNDVSNQGVITTPQGQVVLAAGSSVSLVDTATPHISVTVSAPAGGQAFNLGQVTAAGGSIDMYGALVRQQGVVSADSAHIDAQGQVVLSATQSVDVAAGGSTTATNSAGQGGTVHILAPQVAVAGAIDVSGSSGGGTVLAGGDYQGSNAAVPNALTTDVASTASIKADATGTGNGGKVIVWANDSTRVNGSISAMGGAGGGHGGFVETSGHVLDVTGITVNAQAPKGLPGNWLLDPINVTIAAAGETAGSWLNGTWTPSATGSTVLNTSLEIALNAGTNVTVTTNGGSASDLGDINVNAPITKTGAALSNLTLNAAHNINLDNAITSTGGVLNLSLNAQTGVTQLGNATVALGGGAMISEESPPGPGVAGARGVVSLAAGKTFTANSDMLVSGLNLTGGTLQGSGAVTVMSNYNQTGGAINTTGALSINQLIGTLNLGNITAGSLALASAGDIQQTATSGLVAGGLTTSSAKGAALNGTANQVARFTASNTGTGNVELVNGVALAVQGIDASNGNITITNTGGITTTGEVTAKNGNLSMTANSPLTIGGQGVSASGDIALVTTNLTSSGDMTLNAPVTSGAGAINLKAANNYVQNSAVSAATGVTASAGGSMTLDPKATTHGRPVAYTAAGVSQSPPSDPDPLASVSFPEPEQPQTCLTNPTLCEKTLQVVHLQGSDTDMPSTDNRVNAISKISYQSIQAVVASAEVVTYKEIVHARTDARRADDAAQIAEDLVLQAQSPEEKSAAQEVAKFKSGDADAKRATAKMAEAESERQAAEHEVTTASSEHDRVRAESRRAVAESKHAEAAVDKADAESRMAESELKTAKTPEAKNRAELKLAAAQAQKTEAEVHQAETDVKKAEVEVRQAEVQARASTSAQAQDTVALKQAAVQSKRADAELKQAQAELNAAKTSADADRAQEKLAAAEIKKSGSEAHAAELEARHAQTRAQSPEAAPVDQHRAAVKQADADVKKADVELKQSARELKSATTEDARQAAIATHARADAHKAQLEAQKADREVAMTEALATAHPQAQQDIQAKKAGAAVKAADAEVKMAQAEVHTAKEPHVRDAAVARRNSAELKKSQAELRSAELAAKRDQDDASAPQSAYVKLAVDKRAIASTAVLQTKKAELEVRQVQLAVKHAEAALRHARTPDEKAVAQQHLEAVRTQASAIEQKAAALKADADAKTADAVIAKRSSDSKIIEIFGGMTLTATAQTRIKSAMEARHAFMTETLKPALEILQANPQAADLPTCGASSGDVCIRQASLATDNQPPVIMPRVQSPVVKPVISYLPAIVRKVAVVIGNNAYLDPKIPSLDGAIKDADAIADLLKAKLGYEVRMVHNGTKADIIRQLNLVSDETGSEDSVVVYYAGHGYQMQDTKEGYWIPSDASVKDPGNWVSNADITKILTNIPAKQMILMSDSCYSGALTNEQRVTAGTDSSNVQDILGKRSVLVMSSGGEEPVLDEGREGHSIFAWHLMDRLNHVAQYKNGFDIFEAVKAAVIKDGIPQTPQYGASPRAGHKTGGEYLFEVRQY